MINKQISISTHIYICINYQSSVVKAGGKKVFAIWLTLIKVLILYDEEGSTCIKTCRKEIFSN